MRLVNTTTLELRHFTSGEVPDYVILSHRWEREEIIFGDIVFGSLADPNNPKRKKFGFAKVQGACALAAQDGYQWIWIDSCCIDKTSSAELTEAINSMWDYYADSEICYVYMTDVPDLKSGLNQTFKTSEWFTRGWTLQELVAPEVVEFYAEDWSPIGTKLGRCEEIAEITGVDADILNQAKTIDDYPVVEKLSWAAHRRVTRAEDEAYSLMGFHDVKMPLLYGEGREKAFIRLQKEIYSSTNDQSLFFFNRSQHIDCQPMLAGGAIQFCQRINCEPCKAFKVQCFPPDIAYRNVQRRNLWYYQAHESIYTYVTKLLNETTVTLSMINFEDVRDDLIYLGDEREDKSVFTHVAILNVTLKAYEDKDSALCFLMSQPKDELKDDAFDRSSCFPVILPDVSKYSSKITKRPILVCQNIVSPENKRAIVTFSLVGDSFTVSEWTAKNTYHDLSNPPLAPPEPQEDNNNNTHYTVAVPSYDDEDDEPDKKSEVTVRITDSLHHQPSSSQLCLRLHRFRKGWSIKDLSELGPAPGDEDQRAETLYRPRAMADACTVATGGGRRRLAVALKRKAAAVAPGRVERGGGDRGGDGGPQSYYQVVLRRL